MAYIGNQPSATPLSQPFYKIHSAYQDSISSNVDEQIIETINLNPTIDADSVTYQRSVFQKLFITSQVKISKAFILF